MPERKKKIVNQVVSKDKIKNWLVSCQYFASVQMHRTTFDDMEQ